RRRGRTCSSPRSTAAPGAEAVDDRSCIMRELFVSRRIWSALVLAVAAGVVVAAQAPPAAGGRQGAAGRAGGAAPPPSGVPRAPLGDGPWTFEAAEQTRLRVSVVAK